MQKKAQEIYDYIRSNPNQTEREIADGVGLKKTPYTWTILKNLVAGGYLARYAEDGNPRLTYHYYVQETEQIL